MLLEEPCSFLEEVRKDNKVRQGYEQLGRVVVIRIASTLDHDKAPPGGRYVPLHIAWKLMPAIRADASNRSSNSTRSLQCHEVEHAALRYRARAAEASATL